MKYKLKQCVMKKKCADGSVLTATSYIPAKFAKVGKTLKLKDNDVWHDGYVVESVGGEITSDSIAEVETRFKRQRNASDRMRSDKD